MYGHCFVTRIVVLLPPAKLRDENVFSRVCVILLKGVGGLYRGPIPCTGPQPQSIGHVQTYSTWISFYRDTPMFKLVTTHKRSCWKLMLSHMSVRHSVHGGPYVTITHDALGQGT